ncbi:hypothetical protein KGP36_07700, partial [Patescibacteria group bacterium]|nr:hypothetical protein [Patescibacteria group bacterium]
IIGNVLWYPSPQCSILFVGGRGGVPFEIVKIYRKFVELSKGAGCSLVTFDTETTKKDFSGIAKRIGAVPSREVTYSVYL